MRSRLYVLRGVLGIVLASLLTLLAVGSPAAAKVSGHSLAAATSAPASTRDSLYIGDATDNTIKRFDAQTGMSQGVFVPTTAGLHGPRGILHLSNNRFLVANQNVDLPVSGEIDQFNVVGKSLGALVPSSDPDAPFAPRGIILGPDKRTLYVADIGNGDVGAVKKYDVHSGKFLGNLNFDKWVDSNHQFHPRGLAFGPDGRLYVSLVGIVGGNIDQLPGWILSYDLKRGKITLVASNNQAKGCGKYLHRPEGLTFGPDGRLYVTSFRKDANDIDRILIFNTASGTCADTIGLDKVGEVRAYAQYILFGPRGYLFVPINNDPPNAGAVRRYDVRTKTFMNFVAPGGPLGSGPLDPLNGAGWGLTFGDTNPVTLAYENTR